MSLRKIAAWTPQSTPGGIENATYESGTKAASSPFESDKEGRSCSLREQHIVFENKGQKKYFNL
jgi:hypothetical protein